MAKDNLTPPGGQPIQPAFYNPQGDGVSAAGQAVINGYAETINQFVTKQRDAVRLGGLDQHRATFSAPDLLIEYHHVFGQERIALTPTIQTQEPPTYILPAIPEEPPPVFEQPVIPDVTTPTGCLLVLYSTNRVAAIDMASLASQQAFDVVYSALAMYSSFQQPVKTAQYTFGGISFIQTDVDLSGKMLAKSTMCTTALFDTISLPRQCTPYMASITQPSAQITDGASITVYTAAGSVNYLDGKLTIGTTNATTQQCCAIDSGGRLIYGPTWTGQSLSLTVNDTTLDTTLVQPAIDAAQDAASTYVYAYTVNYVEYIQERGSYDSEGSVKNVTGHSADGQPYVVHINGSTTTVTENDISTVYLTSTVSPSDATGTHAGQYNITEFGGQSYFATATYAEPMVLQNVIIAHDNTYYYTYSFSDNYYEQLTVPSTDPIFDGTLYRMADFGGGTTRIIGDTVQARAATAYTLTTTATQNFPSFGGDLITGFTTLADTQTMFGPEDGGGVKTNATAQEQVVVHTTVDPSPAPAGGYINLSFEQVMDFVQNIIQQMNTPVVVDGVTLPLGPSGTFTGSFNSNTVSTYQVNYTTDANGNPVITGDTYTGPTTTTSSDPVDRAPPGYKTQNISSVFDGSISWNGTIVTAHIDSQQPLDATSAEIEVCPFPPGTPTAAFAKVTTTFGINPSIASFITPFGPLSAPQLSSSLTGWLHVTNSQHSIHGIMVDAVPHLYLDGQDMMARLTRTLQCQPTDIAAMYMDIDLETIKLLAKVQ